jgi:type I restriction-modification system DNA methylase subunit
MAIRKNETLTDFTLLSYLKESKVFAKNWTVKKIPANDAIQECLDKSSKSGSNERGEPDLIYINENKNLLILVENKDLIKDHQSKDGKNPKGFAVDGIKHYLSFFTLDKLKNRKETTQNYLKDWNIVGIAFSGDIHDQYNHLISTFIISENKIIDIDTKEILDEQDYISFFENIDLEQIATNISKSSSEINRYLRAIDSQKRPILLSALMICLYERVDFANDFKQSYQNWSIANIIRNIPTTIEDILNSEGIDLVKIQVLINELAFVKTDNDLTNTNILKDILKELQNNVLPLFDRKTNYDIIGKFYEEFLSYAGVTNVKKGIVLTPNHITKLFTELIPIKNNDVIFDSCCGTGAFLIAGMNKLISEIEDSTLDKKTERIKKLKQNQLIGFEKSSTMYSLAISNMLFRGDGKSRIFNADFFSTEADELLKKLETEGIKPTIGFINPPYSGKDNKTDPTKKEIQFLEKTLDSVSRYGVIIAPLSTFFKDEIERNRILTKHSLKYVINMPSELFQPNAATHTAIAVFETHQPHNNNEVVFYDLTDDGFVLSKNKGRTDVLNRWNNIKKDLLQKIKNPNENQDFTTLVNTKIKENDEWIIQAHSKSDYSKITAKNFTDTIKRFIIFTIKFKLNLLDANIDELTFMEILNDNKISKESFNNKNLEIYPKNWSSFKLNELFKIDKGERLVKLERELGTTPLLTASAYNNGISNYIDYNAFKNNKKIFENRITVDMFCSVFYHDYQYFSDDNIHTLSFLNKNFDVFYENKYVNLFLVTVLKELTNKFDYGRQVRLKRFEEEIISLPSKKHNNVEIPDFEFMEMYIKSLPYSSSII